MFRFVLLASALVGHASSKSLLKLTAPSTGNHHHHRRLDGEEDDISWLKDYNAVYANCFHSEQSVAYYLCPRDNSNAAQSSRCRNSCQVDCEGGAQYLADLAYFIDTFTEAQMEAREYRCEYARENCNYDDDSMCFSANNENGVDLSYCQDDWGEELDIQEYLECKEIEDGYYVGPYCAENNIDIFLAVFTDEDCTEHADDDNSVFYDTFGYELPYSTESLIGSAEEGNNCASCKEHALQEDKNEGDQEDDDDVLEQCENLYEYTYTKCETNLDIGNPDTSGCDYVKELRTTEQVSTTSNSTGGSSSKSKRLWMVFLFVGLAVVGAAAYVVHKKQRAQKSKKAKLSVTTNGDASTKKETLLS